MENTRALSNQISDTQMARDVWPFLACYCGGTRVFSVQWFAFISAGVITVDWSFLRSGETGDLGREANVTLPATKMAERGIFTFKLLLCICSFYGIRASLYSKDDPMEILDNSTIKRQIYKSEYVWVVEFYSSWCGHCHAFAPTWRRFAKQIMRMYTNTL